MMWIDVQQLSPLLGPVRHLTGHRWQHYDGLGIVIQDACHLFTSQPSLISHHRPYNLADTLPNPTPPLPDTLYKTTPYITTATPPSHPPSSPPTLSLSPSYIPRLNTVNTFNALIYVLCSPISGVMSSPVNLYPWELTGFYTNIPVGDGGKLKSNLHSVWTMELLNLFPKTMDDIFSITRTCYCWW